MSYRDKVNGNELDLSLNQLTEVPVKELAVATKATHLDISCNHITLLPNDFSTLTHLIKIDLSKNRLTELPANFGNLVSLQTLDLYENRIVNLPLSFCRLKNLRWLDLNSNPLDVKLTSVAGDCLNEKQCQDCAKKVVSYMQSLESDFEREKQKKLKVQREMQAIEKARQEKLLQQERQAKKIEKEKRKAAAQVEKEARKALQKNPRNIESEDVEDDDLEDAIPSPTNGSKLIYFGVIVCLLLCGLIYFCEYGSYQKSEVTSHVCEVYGNFKNVVKVYFDKLLSHSSPPNCTDFFQGSLKFFRTYIVVAKDTFLKIVHGCMTKITESASEFEILISTYL